MQKCKPAHFETRKDRYITYVKMKEKEEIRFYPPISLTAAKVSWDFYSGLSVMQLSAVQGEPSIFKRHHKTFNVILLSYNNHLNLPKITTTIFFY